MASDAIPEDIRRFVLTSIASVPHLEALLLLRAHEHERWSAARVAQRLYIGDKVALALMADLCQAGMTTSHAEPGQPPTYHYAPGSAALRAMIDQLAVLYSRRLLDITGLIHARLDRKAHQFADAFKWRKDS